MTIFDADADLAMTRRYWAGHEKWSFRDARALFAILLLTAAIRLPTLYEPWGGDQGVYGYIADRMLAGEMPYRDLYTNTGYGLFFLYAMFLKLFGNNMASIHIGDFLAHLTTVVLVYSLARLLYGRECGAIAAIGSAIFGIARAFSGLVDMKGAWGTYWQLAQREAFMTPLLTAAILCAILAERRKSSTFCALAGACAGLAAMLKVTAALMLLLIIAYIAIDIPALGQKRDIPRRIRMCAAAVISFAVVNLPFLFYFFLHHGLREMYLAVFLHTSIYAKLSRGNIVADAFMGNTYVLVETLALWLFAFAGLTWLLVNDRTKNNYLVAAWTTATLLVVWGQGKFFGYHFLLILAPFCILASVAMVRLMKTETDWIKSALSSARDPVRLFAWLLLAYNLAVFSWSHYEYYRWSFLYLSSGISKQQYYDVFNEYPLHLYSFRADYEVAEYLKRNADKKATLREINGGGETVVNYLSGIKSVTRFTSTWYLFNKTLYSYPLTIALRRELIDGIRSEKPDYVLLVYYTADQFRKEYSDPKYQDVHELLDDLETYYVVERAFRDGRTLYKRL